MSKNKCKEYDKVINNDLEYSEYDKNIKKDYISFNVNRLSVSPFSIIISIILFISLVGVISSNLIFLNTIRGSLTLQQASINIYYQEYIELYPTIILNIAFISIILSCISKRFNTISKVGYLINMIISILLFFNLYSNNLRVGISFFIIVLINTLLFIIPIKYNITEEEILIEKKKESLYEKKNIQIKDLFNKKIITKIKVLITLIILIIESIFLIIIVCKNNNDIYKETIIQANSDFQIKIINDYINIRSDYNTESKVLGTVNKDDIYNVLDITNTANHIWYKIDYKGKIGYIASPRIEPYIEELYNDKLVVNIFCTKDNKDCAYLMEFILKYQKSTAKSFLIKYQDLEEKNTKDIYNILLEYYNIEESIPFLVIGDDKIENYTKDSNQDIINIIEEQINSKKNIVIDIKKGNIELPKKD